jgi:hypothetical protein
MPHFGVIGCQPMIGGEPYNQNIRGREEPRTRVVTGRRSTQLNYAPHDLKSSDLVWLPREFTNS